MTNEHGLFVLNDVPVGEHSVHIRLVGYRYVVRSRHISNRNAKEIRDRKRHHDNQCRFGIAYGSGSEYDRSARDACAGIDRNPCEPVGGFQSKLGDGSEVFDGKEEWIPNWPGCVACMNGITRMGWTSSLLPAHAALLRIVLPNYLRTPFSVVVQETSFTYKPDGRRMPVDEPPGFAGLIGRDGTVKAPTISYGHSEAELEAYIRRELGEAEPSAREAK